MKIKKLLVISLSIIYFSNAHAMEEVSNPLEKLNQRAAKLKSEIQALSPIINAEGKTYQNLLPKPYDNQKLFSDSDLNNLKMHWKSLGVTQAKERQLLLGLEARTVRAEIDKLTPQYDSSEIEGLGSFVKGIAMSVGALSNPSFAQGLQKRSVNTAINFKIYRHSSQ